jgi:hypothetical protein
MRREPPDSRFYVQIRDLNLAFLELVSMGRQRRHGPVFGLDTAVADQISRFNPAQLGEMAATPCLLAGVATSRGARLRERVAEPAPAGDPEWAGQAALFAAGLLTYVWQMARRDSLCVALCAGTTFSMVNDELRFADIRGLANRALHHVEARFLGHARFWPDLVRAARDGHPDRLQLARLSAIQLATSEAGRAPAPPLAAFVPRLACVTAGTR